MEPPAAVVYLEDVSATVLTGIAAVFKYLTQSVKQQMLLVRPSKLPSD